MNDKQLGAFLLALGGAVGQMLDNQMIIMETVQEHTFGYYEDIDNAMENTGRVIEAFGSFLQEFGGAL